MAFSMPNKRGCNMKLIVYMNFFISLIFTMCYFYQLVYVLIGLVKKKPTNQSSQNHRFAVVVSARKISEEIESLK